MPSDKCIPKLNNKKKFLHFTFYVRLLFGVRYLPKGNFQRPTLPKWQVTILQLGVGRWEVAVWGKAFGKVPNKFYPVPRKRRGSVLEQGSLEECKTRVGGLE